MTRIRNDVFSLAIIALCGAASAGDHQGAINGFFDFPERVQSISVIDRQAKRAFLGKIDHTTGEFGVAGLPLGATYDVIVEFSAPGSPTGVLEGINMAVPPSDYIEEQPLSDEDIAIIRDKIRRMNSFEDMVTILAIGGNIQHAAILLNKLRTQPFYGSKPGEVIWRLELWHYEHPEETWFKSQDELSIVLHRERLQRSGYDEKCLILDPNLGGLVPTGEDPDIKLGKIVIPENKPGIRVRNREKKAFNSETATTVDEGGYRP